MDWDHEGPSLSTILFFIMIMISLFIGALISLVGLIFYYLLPVLLVIDLIIRVKAVNNKTGDKHEAIKVALVTVVELVLTWLICSRMFAELAFPGTEGIEDSIFSGIALIFAGIAISLAVMVGYVLPRVYLLLNHDYETKYCLYTSLVCSVVSVVYYAMFYA